MLNTAKDKAMDYYFDEAAANKAVRFIETQLTHTKGAWAGKPLLLEEWQKNEIIRPLFGWKKPDGTRKYRKAFIFLPRKNGKSLLAASIALYALIADGEQGAEVYSAATDRDQAKLVFEMAKTMVQKNPKLSQYVQPYQYSLFFRQNNSSYKYVSADAGGKHGYNSHCVIYDELHAAKDRELYDVFDTSFGSRSQPLYVMITTAGFDRQTICFEQYDYACKVRDGIIKDETFLPVIYEATPEDDIFSEETWKKANPNYGVSIYKDYLKEQANKAHEMPSYENTFRRLHLNQWTTSETRWISDETWMDCDHGVMDMTGRLCYCGLDLASNRDITAFVMIFRLDDVESWYVEPYFFIPELNARERTRKDGVNYDMWIKQGYIIETPGDVTDYNFIRTKIIELSKKYEIRGIAYDRWNASQLVVDLSYDAINMVEYGQGFASMSAPTKELERLVLSNKINHAGNPVLRWMCSNVMLRQDPAGNVKIDKSKSTDKVDGMVSLVMALGYKMTADPEPGMSSYETNEIFFL